MSLLELEDVIGDFHAVAAQWNEQSGIARMRADLDRFFASFAPGFTVRAKAIETPTVRGVLVDAADSDADRAVLLLHGGGFAVGSPVSHRPLADWIAKSSGSSVFLLDYRLAPEHLFPAPLEDAVAAWHWLLDRGIAAERIAVAGDSAGGGLALALLAELRNERTALPGCAVLISPWADLECKGDSYVRNAAIDPISSREVALGMGRQYLGEAGDARDPRASSLHIDYAGLPPLLIHAGEREVFLDDAREVARRARAAGVAVQFEEWPGMIHEWHLYASRLEEGREAIERVGRFIGEYTR